MSRGGSRPGAGRKPGSKAQKTKQRLLAATHGLADGISPLDYMLNLLRSEPPEQASDAQRAAHEAMRFEAAKAAAPYVHPRLSTINANASLQGGVTISIVSEFPDG